LGLASAVILRSESRGTHDDILLSQIRDCPNLEDQVPVFIYPGNRVARVGHVVKIGAKMNAHRILVENPERKKPLGRPKRKWVDNIKMDIREIRWGGMDLIYRAQDREQWRDFVNTVINLRVP
jgi:hypothetical protein